jgi:hypothetical protein
MAQVSSGLPDSAQGVLPIFTACPHEERGPTPANEGSLGLFAGGGKCFQNGHELAAKGLRRFQDSSLASVYLVVQTIGNSITERCLIHWL